MYIKRIKIYKLFLWRCIFFMTDEIREIISKYDSLEEARSKSRGQEKVLINMYADNKKKN